MIQDGFRYYLMAFADVDAGVLAACDAQNTAGTTSLVFLNRDLDGAPQEITIKVQDAFDDWEAGQAWIQDAINVFQFDPPAARGDIDDRILYVAENKMSWPTDGSFPQWYIDVWTDNALLRPYMTDPG
jgi:hypothetical protein